MCLSAKQVVYSDEKYWFCQLFDFFCDMKKKSLYLYVIKKIYTFSMGKTLDLYLHLFLNIFNKQDPALHMFLFDLYLYSFDKRI